LVSKQFEEAKDKITTLKEEPSNEIKLKIYALFKQATVGKCNVKKPGMTDFVAR
jgi:peroxisomal 3,2-trans-enoyl-CoA isomerase